MAEFIEHRIQEMVPEVEEAERCGLLSPIEIKKLIQKRRNFLYKTSKFTKEKQHFVNYVLFEIKLLELLSLRRQQILMFECVDKIETPISIRIVKTLRRMSRSWPTYSDIWKLRISFAKSKKLFDEVSVAYAEQVKLFGNNEDLWIAWAQFEMEGRFNFDMARSILLSRAPLYHPDSIKITKEYFRLELLFIEYLKKNARNTTGSDMQEIVDNNREKVLEGDIPEVVYQNTLKKFQDNVEIFLQFFTIADHFSFAQSLRNKILRDLITRFPNHKNIWKLRGRMIMKGEVLSLSQTLNEDVQGKEDEGSIKGTDNETEFVVKTEKLNATEKVNKLLKMYDEALVKVDSFLECFVRDLFCLLYEVWGVEDLFTIVTKKLSLLLEKKSSHLSATEFLYWYHLSLHLKKDSKVLKRIVLLGSSLHPSCHRLQLLSLSFNLPSQTKQYKKQMIKNLCGKTGADLCKEILSHTKPFDQMDLYNEACNHTDATVAEEMRLHQMEMLFKVKGVIEGRLHYKKYNTLPPQSLHFHAAMLKRELQEENKSLNQIRQVFKIAISQFGRYHSGLWLCNIEFERICGNDPKRMSELMVEMEEKLDSKFKQEFTDRKFALESSLSKESNENEESILVDCPEEETDLSSYEFWKESDLCLFEEEPPLMYSCAEERKNFFASLAAVSRDIEEVPKTRKGVNDVKMWENLLTLIHGKDVSLEVKRVNVHDLGTEKDARDFIQQSEKQFESTIQKRRTTLSDRLKSEAFIQKPGAGVSSEVQQILSSSETLKPTFLEQKQLDPHFLSRRRGKNLRKKERQATAGENWFNMKAPELTEEVKRDLKVLKMRSVLDPHRHYKRNDMKEIPKYFQLGKVIDSPQDYYSSRLPKKERKRHIAEEVMNDEQVLSYQKRKTAEITQNKERTKRKKSNAQREMGKRNSKKKKRFSK